MYTVVKKLAACTSEYLVLIDANFKTTIIFTVTDARQYKLQFTCGLSFVSVCR
jgi:hypothetical protein